MLPRWLADGGFFVQVSAPVHNLSNTNFGAGELDAAINAMSEGDCGGEGAAINLEDPCNRSATIILID
jgi:hypothetical protein